MWSDDGYGPSAPSFFQWTPITLDTSARDRTSEQKQKLMLDLLDREEKLKDKVRELQLPDFKGNLNDTVRWSDQAVASKQRMIDMLAQPGVNPFQVANSQSFLKERANWNELTSPGMRQTLATRMGDLARLKEEQDRRQAKGDPIISSYATDAKGRFIPDSENPGQWIQVGEAGRRAEYDPNWDYTGSMKDFDFSNIGNIKTPIGFDEDLHTIFSTAGSTTSGTSGPPGFDRGKLDSAGLQQLALAASDPSSDIATRTYAAMRVTEKTGTNLNQLRSGIAAIETSLDQHQRNAILQAYTQTPEFKIKMGKSVKDGGFLRDGALDQDLVERQVFEAPTQRMVALGRKESKDPQWTWSQAYIHQRAARYLNNESVRSLDLNDPIRDSSGSGSGKAPEDTYIGYFMGGMNRVLIPDPKNPGLLAIAPDSDTSPKEVPVQLKSGDGNASRHTMVTTADLQTTPLIADNLLKAFSLTKPPNANDPKQEVSSGYTRNAKEVFSGVPNIILQDGKTLSGNDKNKFLDGATIREINPNAITLVPIGIWDRSIVSYVQPYNGSQELPLGVEKEIGDEMVVLPKEIITTPYASVRISQDLGKLRDGGFKVTVPADNQSAADALRSTSATEWRDVMSFKQAALPNTPAFEAKAAWRGKEIDIEDAMELYPDLYRDLGDGRVEIPMMISLPPRVAGALDKLYEPSELNIGAQPDPKEVDRYNALQRILQNRSTP